VWSKYGSHSWTRYNQSGLSCDKQKERGINRCGLTHTARPTGSLAVDENRIIVTGSVGGVTPAGYGGVIESVGLHPSAKATDCPDVFAKIDLVTTCTEPEGIRGNAIETARNSTIGIDCGRVEYHASVYQVRRNSHVSRRHTRRSVITLECAPSACQTDNQPNR